MTDPGTMRFIFLSQILKRKVKDAGGRTVGTASDLTAYWGDIYPPTQALWISTGGWTPGVVSVGWKDVDMDSVFLPSPIRLKVAANALPVPASPGENEFFLRKELLDNQIVDTHGRKVVRVNDVHLMQTNGTLRIVHVDVGLRGIFRSLGWEKGIDVLVRFFVPHASYLSREQYVSWKYVQPVSVGSLKRGLLKLSVTMKKLSKLHPADLAEIMEDLNMQQRSALFQSFDLETAAETLGESNPKVQQSLLETIGAEKAADILEEMPPDKAADILADMPREEASELLTKMKQKEAQEVTELLSYEEDTAGGLMTTEFITSPRDFPVSALMNKIRSEVSTTESVYYIFVTEEGGKLVGVVTLKDLLLAQPDRLISEIMAENPVAVSPEESMKGMVDIFGKYKLLALPVVDRDGAIRGIVTMDDLLSHVFSRQRTR